MAYDLAVTYSMVRVGRREFYSYCDHMYSTKNKMLEEILKDHPSVKSSKIVLLNTGTYISHENFQRAAEYIYENPFPVFANRQLGLVIIQAFCFQGITIYYCANKMFYDYKKAKMYARLMDLKVRFDFKKKPNPKVPKEIDVLKKVGWFSFSDIIWRRVWKNCYYYKCFAANGFKQFKLRVLNEINYYRMLHNSKPVSIHRVSSKHAEAYLESILKTDGKHLDRRLLQNFKSSPYYFAPLIVKNWYDENKRYNYKTKVAIAGTEHFTAMVWKAVKHIGIAIREINERIYMVVVFEPIPNGVKLFSSNVQKRKYTPFG
uniref:SCP domain-containing protein n=1 Tax=Strongyloides papillosus TaxID=174720 RepID=A0A0N5BQH5_STREA